MKIYTLIIASVLFAVCTSLIGAEWETMDTIGEPVARHEAAFVEFEGEFYLLGGRGIRPVSIYSPETNSWREGSPPPVEVHHFQPIVYKDRILMIGAFTGGWPRETPLDRVIAYVPGADSWEWGAGIPAARRRGASGVALVDEKIYIVGGIVNGHVDGHVDWFDEYSPESGEWKILPRAPHKRDHFQVGVLDGKLYAVGGRLSSIKPGVSFSDVVPEVDVYDFERGEWSVLKTLIPTPRAGSFTMTFDSKVVVAGGESGAQVQAHDEVEAYDTRTERWTSLPSLQRGRHGTGIFLFGGHLYTCSGCGNRGGSPELTSMERFKIE